MSPLSLLSKYQLIAFLAVWCDLKDVTLLDSAVCMRNERKLILDIFNNETPFLQYYPCRDEGPLIVWLWVRKIKLSSIALYESGVSMSTFIICDNVFCLTISECSKNVSSHKIASLINHCSRLTELSIKHVSDFIPETCEQVSIRIWKQLIKVTFEIHRDNGLLIKLAKVCHNLNSFNFVTKSTSCENYVEVLFKNNQQLQKLTMRLRRSSEFFNAVLEHAPLLKEIELYHVEDNCVAALVAFMTEHKVLEKISLTTTYLDPEDEYFDIDGKLVYDKGTGTLALSYYAHDWAPLLTTISGVIHFKLKKLDNHNPYLGDVEFFKSISNNTLRQFIGNNCDTLESICIGDEKGDNNGRYDVTEYALIKCAELKHLILPQLHHGYEDVLPRMLQVVPNNRIEHFEYHSHFCRTNFYVRETLTLLPNLKQFSYGDENRISSTFKNNLNDIIASFPHVSFVEIKYPHND